MMATVLRILRHTDLVTSDPHTGAISGALRSPQRIPKGARRSDGVK